MKKIIFLILVFICAKNSYTQIRYNPELDKFVGTWKWMSGTDTVIVILEKQVQNMPTKNNLELIVGWHKYVKNGQVVESSLQHAGLNINGEDSYNGSDLRITLRGNTRAQIPKRLWFYTFWDLTLHKRSYVYLTLLPNSTTQASWNLRGQSVLPSDLVLTKQ